MATTDGKFTNSNFTLDNYKKTFDGATKVPAKIKLGGSEEDGAGFVADAVDLDWGGLKLTYVYETDDTTGEGNATKTLATGTVSSDSQHTSDNLTGGIKSTGYLLSLISQSLELLQQKAVANSDAINTAVGGVDLSGLTEKVNKLSSDVETITNELGYDGSSLVTLIDQLRGAIDKDTSLSEYVGIRADLAKSSAVRSANDYTDSKIESLNHHTVDYSSTDEALVITDVSVKTLSSIDWNTTVSGDITYVDSTKVYSAYTTNATILGSSSYNAGEPYQEIKDVTTIKLTYNTDETMVENITGILSYMYNGTELVLISTSQLDWYTTAGVYYIKGQYGSDMVTSNYIVWEITGSDEQN